MAELNLIKYSKNLTIQVQKKYLEFLLFSLHMIKQFSFHMIVYHIFISMTSFLKLKHDLIRRACCLNKKYLLFFGF